MKRPFFVVGSTMLFTLFLLNGLEYKAMSVAFAAALIAFSISIFFKGSRQDKTLPTAFFCVLLSICILGIAECKVQKKTKVIDAKTIEMQAVLEDIPVEQDGRFYYLLRATQIEGHKANELVRLSLEKPLELTANDVLYAKTKLFTFEDDFFDTSIKRYYKSKNIFLRTNKLTAYQIKENLYPSLKSKILNLRMHLLEGIMQTVPEDTNGILSAMTLGAGKTLSKSIKNQFKIAGVSHLLVVSGLHLTTFCGWLFLGLQKLQLHRKKRALIGILATAFLAVLMGGAPSVLRAAFMIAMVYAADLFSREADGLNSVGFALFVMLLQNPFAAHSLTLLLSSFSTIGILLFSKRIETFFLSFFKKWKHKKVLYQFLEFCIDVFAVTCSVTIATVPIQILKIGTFSLYALLGNFLLVFVAGFLMIFAMLGAIFAALSLPALALTFFTPSIYVAKYMLFVTKFIAQLPFALLPIDGALSKGVLALFCLCLSLYFFFCQPKPIVLRRLALTFSALFICTTLFAFNQQERKLEMIPISSKKGMSILMHCQGKNILFCDECENFSDAAICDILYSYGATKLDVAVLPNENPKAVQELSEVTEQYPIETLYFAPSISKEYLPKCKFKKEIFKEVVPICATECVLLLCRENGANYAEIVFQKAKCRISFSETNHFQNSGATLFLTDKSIPNYGFSPKAYSMILLSAQDAKADFLCLQNEEVYTLSENPNIEFILTKQGKIECKSRR